MTGRLEVVHILSLTCGVCGARDQFKGATQKMAIDAARTAGWRVTIKPNRARCPDHAGQKKSKRRWR